MPESEASIWKRPIDLETINAFSPGTMVGHLGIVITEVGKRHLCGSMPVDGRTRQVHGLLHGGASVALSETLGSIAGNYCLHDDNEVCVGLAINANHVRSVVDGTVIGKAVPVHLGKRTQVWRIEIRDERQRLVHVSRLTLAVVERE